MKLLLQAERYDPHFLETRAGLPVYRTGYCRRQLPKHWYLYVVEHFELLTFRVLNQRLTAQRIETGPSRSGDAWGKEHVLHVDEWALSIIILVISWHLGIVA